MKKNKNLFLILGLVSLVFSLNCINTTYAKYATKAIANSEFNIARWDIVVNNEHIKNSSVEVASITPNYVNNQNVASGKIAPGSVGYFDITIDGSLTDVSFDFSIDVLPDENSAVTDLKIMKYYIDSIDNLEDASPGDLIASSIEINDINKTKIIRIYIIWDDVDGSMDNISDSIAGHNAESENGSVLVKINFKQKI